MPDVQSLLLERRDVTPDAGEVLAAFLRSEASRNLALDTPGTYIAFSLVVVEGDTFVVEQEFPDFKEYRAGQERY